MPELSPEDIQEAWINSHTTTLPHIPGMVSPMQKFESPFIHGYELKVENPGEMNTYFIQLQIKGNPMKHYWIMPAHKMIGLSHMGLAINHFWNLNIQMNQMGWLPLEGSKGSEPEKEFEGNPFEGDSMFQEASLKTSNAEDVGVDIGIGNIPSKEIHKGDTVVINTGALQLDWGLYQSKITAMIGKPYEVLMIQDGPTPQADIWIENHHWMIPVSVLTKISSPFGHAADEEEEDTTMENPFEGDEMFKEGIGDEHDWNDDSDEDYEYKHEHSGIEIGDIVKVVYKAHEYEGGWNTNWLPEMDAWVGGQYEVVGDEVDGGWTLRDPKSGQMWAFPYFSLEIVKKVDKKEKKKKQMQYLKAHNASGFKPGDVVTVTTEAQSYEKGWGYDWNEHMTDELVGEEFEIMEDDGAMGFIVQTEDGQQYHVPYFVLQKEGSAEETPNPFEGDEMFREVTRPTDAQLVSLFCKGSFKNMTSDHFGMIDGEVEGGWGLDFGTPGNYKYIAYKADAEDSSTLIYVRSGLPDALSAAAIEQIKVAYEKMHIDVIEIDQETMNNLITGDLTPAEVTATQTINKNPFEGDEMFKEAVPPRVPSEYSRDPFGAENQRQDAERKRTQMTEPRPQEDESIVPDDFLFESKVVFISNLEEIPKALGDRVLAIQLNYDKDQALNLIDEKLQTLVPEYPELTIEHKREILAFLRKYKGTAKHISLRTFVHVASIWASNDPEKEKWALVQLQSQV